MMPLSDFLAAAGLPQWDELGLPAIAEMLKPVGGPSGIQFPSMAEAYTQANAVFKQVLAAQLPSSLKGAAANVNLPKPLNVNITAVAAKLNITQDLFKTLTIPGLNTTASSALNAVVGSKLKAVWGSPIRVNGVKMPFGVPSYNEVFKAATTTYKLARAIQKMQNETAGQQVVTIVKAVAAAAKSKASSAASSLSG